MTQDFTDEHRAKLIAYLQTHDLPSGLGDEESACTLAAIRLAYDGKLNDDVIDCMSLVLGKAAMLLQDAMPDEMRNSARYKGLIPNMPGTGRKLEAKRLAVLMDWMWTVVLPQFQPIADNGGFGAEWRNMCETKTPAAARAANAAANAAYADAATYAAADARAAYAYAARATYAAADAANAAYAGAAGAYTAANAAANAAYADAAAYAANAANAAANAAYTAANAAANAAYADAAYADAARAAYADAAAYAANAANAAANAAYTAANAANAAANAAYAYAARAANAYAARAANAAANAAYADAAASRARRTFWEEVDPIGVLERMTCLEKNNAE